MVQKHFPLLQGVLVFVSRLCRMSEIQRQYLWLLLHSAISKQTLWDTTPMLFREWINRITISVLSSCEGDTVTVNHCSCEDLLLRATEIEHRMLILSAFTPELSYGGMFACLMQWHWLQDKCSSSDPSRSSLWVDLSVIFMSLSFLLSPCLLIGLCVRLWCGDFG